MFGLLNTCLFIFICVFQGYRSDKKNLGGLRLVFGLVNDYRQKCIILCGWSLRIRHDSIWMDIYFRVSIQVEICIVSVWELRGMVVSTSLSNTYAVERIDEAGLGYFPYDSTAKLLEILRGFWWWVTRLMTPRWLNTVGLIESEVPLIKPIIY